MSSFQQTCVAPNASNDIQIDNNTITTTVVVGGTSKLATVNVVPSTYLTSGVVTPNMVSTTIYTVLTIPNLDAGVYQLTYSGSFAGSFTAASDLIDTFWSGSVTASPAGADNMITVPLYNYSATRSAGSFGATETVYLPSSQNLLLNFRFTGTGTFVSTTLYPYVSCFKIG